MTMLLNPLAPWLEPDRRLARAAAGPPTFRPPADLLSGEGDTKVVMDVPGLRREDLTIELTDGVLRIRGERRYPYRGREDSHTVSRLERGFGSFERVLMVPKDVDPNAIEASIVDGVLTLSIPRPESRKPHRIEIRGSAEADAIEARATESSVDAARNGKRELAGAGA